MYFADLTPYSYDTYGLGNEDFPYTPTHPELNIGWLETGHPFETGSVPDPLKAFLWKKCLYENHELFCGYHYCDLCPEIDLTSIYAAIPRNPRFERRTHEWSAEEARRNMNVEDAIYKLGLGLGNGVIRITGDSVVYVAPQLVIHYIEKHHYLPSQDFLEALSRQS